MRGGAAPRLHAHAFALCPRPGACAQSELMSETTRIASKLQQELQQLKGKLDEKVSRDESSPCTSTVVGKCGCRTVEASGCVETAGRWRHNAALAPQSELAPSAASEESRRIIILVSQLN